MPILKKHPKLSASLLGSDKRFQSSTTIIHPAMLILGPLIFFVNFYESLVFFFFFI